MYTMPVQGRNTVEARQIYCLSCISEKQQPLNYCEQDS